MQVFYPAGRLLQDRLCRAAAVDKDERFFTGDKTGKRIDPPARVGLDHKPELFFRGRRRHGYEPATAPPAREPREHLLRVTDSRGKPDTLHRGSGDPVETVEQDPEVYAPLRLHKRVQFINDDVPQVRKSCGRPVFMQQDFERFRRNKQKLRGIIRVPPSFTLGNVAMPFGKGEPGRPAERGNPFLLVVDERFKGERYRQATPFAPDFRISSRTGMRAASDLPPAVGAMISVSLPPRIASYACSCTSRSSLQPSRSERTARRDSCRLAYTDGLFVVLHCAGRVMVFAGSRPARCRVTGNC